MAHITDFYCQTDGCDNLVAYKNKDGYICKDHFMNKRSLDFSHPDWVSCLCGHFGICEHGINVDIKVRRIE